MCVPLGTKKLISMTLGMNIMPLPATGVRIL